MMTCSRSWGLSTERSWKSSDRHGGVALNALWIIGNGFDLNVGLHTGYRHFLDGVYLKDGEHSAQRDRLIELVGEDPRLKEGKYWSDLEGLLAFATSKCPEQITDREFTDIFEKMQKLFVEKVAAEQARLVSPLPEEAVTEFWNSATQFPTRMRLRDRRALPCNADARENIAWGFISLNYTAVFDTFLRAAVKTKGAETKRNVGGNLYTDKVSGAVLHPHGVVVGDSDGNEIIFGASPEQFGSEGSAELDLLKEMWVKPNKNREIYGNENTELISERIAKARVFLLYGVSLGDSDRYIWEMIGKRMAEAGVWAVVFNYGLPPSGSQDSMLYYDKRREAQDKFLDVAGIDDENRESVRERIVVASSDQYFVFKGMKLVKEASDDAA